MIFPTRKVSRRHSQMSKRGSRKNSRGDDMFKVGFNDYSTIGNILTSQGIVDEDDYEDIFEIALFFIKMK